MIVDRQGSGRLGEVRVRRWAVLALLAGRALVSAGFAAAAGEGGAPACEPRAHNEAGRLNIAVDPEGYGIMGSCRANLEFYIAQNTPLRSIGAAIRLTAPDGEELAAKTVGVALERTNYGMFAARVDIGSDNLPACRHLSIGLELGDCRGERGEAVACPVARLRVPEWFAEFTVTGQNLVVCRDA